MYSHTVTPQNLQNKYVDGNAVNVVSLHEQDSEEE